MLRAPESYGLLRLAGLARGWGEGRGPGAILACPPGEMHDLALMIFGIALNRAGWRIDYFGAGATAGLAEAVGARLPDGDPVSAATAIGRLR